MNMALWILNTVFLYQNVSNEQPTKC